MDYAKKLSRYDRAGVREYWIIDPLAGHTTVYLLTALGEDRGQEQERSSSHMRTYALDEPVPVGIFAGGLSVRVSDLVDTYDDER